MNITNQNQLKMLTSKKRSKTPAPKVVFVPVTGEFTHRDGRMIIITSHTIIKKNTRWVYLKLHQPYFGNAKYLITIENARFAVG